MSRPSPAHRHTFISTVITEDNSWFYNHTFMSKIITEVQSNNSLHNKRQLPPRLKARQGVIHREKHAHHTLRLSESCASLLHLWCQTVNAHFLLKLYEAFTGEHLAKNTHTVAQMQLYALSQQMHIHRAFKALLFLGVTWSIPTHSIWLLWPFLSPKMKFMLNVCCFETNGTIKHKHQLQIELDILRNTTSRKNSLTILAAVYHCKQWCPAMHFEGNGIQTYVKWPGYANMYSKLYIYA